MAVNSFNAQNPPLTTKGDLFTFSTIPTRLGIGSNNQVLTADSTAATGMKWASSSPSYTWTSWSPTFKQGGTTLTTSSNTSRYIEIGNMVVVYINATYSSTGTAGGQVWITTVPVTVASGSSIFAAGTASFYDASAGSYYFGVTSIGAGTSVQFSSGINKTVNYWGETGSDMTQTIANGDQIQGFIIYQK